MAEPTVQPSVVIVGGINTDFVVKGERVPALGENVNGDLFLETPGGKGSNQAIAAARFGAQVALVGKAGLDRRGERSLARLTLERVDVTHVGRVNDPTGVVLVLVDGSGRKQTMGALGANRRLTASDVDAAKGAFVSARVVVTQLEVPIPAVTHALRLGRAAGAATVLDCAPATQVGDEVLQLVDVLRANPFETEALTGVRPAERAAAERAGRLLLQRGVGAALIQAGREGDLLIMRSGVRMLPRLAVEAVDSTGAGDAFTGVLAAALAEAQPLERAAELGSAAAAFAATRLGAQAGLPYRRDVLALSATTPPQPPP